MANTSASALGLFLLLTEQKGRVGERGLCSVTLSSTVPDRARIAMRLHQRSLDPWLARKQDLMLYGRNCASASGLLEYSTWH
ncbi:hypothetical protein ROHU_021955 [Labeo rohita]|uniref:Uncharacterized protein n=1 Tax=Labeo rohita TaxID=84645 RepID=A0A498N7D3_LABRO|nr:hypothetical protein ROHU_021955 [Labeo rohita]